MKRFSILLLPIIVLIFTMCKQNSGRPDNGLQEVRVDPKMSNADIIRSPASADHPTDTVNVAKMSFQEKIFDFGEVEEGAIVKHVFTFVNTGKTPLLISDASSSCGCTIPSYNKASIAPGQGDAITVQFDTKNKADQQSKAVKIYANTYPSESTVYLKGYVRKK